MSYVLAVAVWANKRLLTLFYIDVDTVNTTNTCSFVCMFFCYLPKYTRTNNLVIRIENKSQTYLLGIIKEHRRMHQNKLTSIL